MQTPISLGIGSFNDVLVVDALTYLAYREGDPREAGKLRVLSGSGPEWWGRALIWEHPLPSGSPAFPRLHWAFGAVWLGYVDHRTGWLVNLTTNTQEEIPAANNSPIAFGGRWVAYRRADGSVVRRDLETGEQVVVRHAAGTGLAWVGADGSVATVDEVRQSVAGMSNPCYAGSDFIVGEGQTGGAAVHLPGFVGALWPGRDSFVPRNSRSGGLVAVSTWGPDVRLFVGTEDELRAAATIQPTHVDVPTHSDIPHNDTPMNPTLPDDIFAALKQARSGFPSGDVVLTPFQIGAVLNTTALATTRPGREVGLQRKDSGTVAIMPDGTSVWNGLRVVLDGQHWGFDVCGACTVGKFVPLQAEGGPADPASFVSPVGSPAHVDLPHTDAPSDPGLIARVAALEKQVLELTLAQQEQLQFNLGVRDGLDLHHAALDKKVDKGTVVVLEGEVTFNEARGVFGKSVKKPVTVKGTL